MNNSTLAPATCEKCGKEITGTRIITVDGRIFCEECYLADQKHYLRVNIGTTIGVYPNGRIVVVGFDCDDPIHICEKCPNRELCAKIRKELDKLENIH